MELYVRANTYANKWSYRLWLSSIVAKTYFLGTYVCIPFCQIELLSVQLCDITFTSHHIPTHLRQTAHILPRGREV